MQNPDVDPDLTIPETAYALNLHDQSVRRLISSGLIRAHRIGRAWRVTRAEIERVRREGIPQGTRAAS